MKAPLIIEYTTKLLYTANTFFRAGMIESWGRGIERIMTACKSDKVPTPKLRYECTGIWVEFKVRGGVQPEKSFSEEPKGS